MLVSRATLLDAPEEIMALTPAMIRAWSSIMICRLFETTPHACCLQSYPGAATRSGQSVLAASTPPAFCVSRQANVPGIKANSLLYIISRIMGFQHLCSTSRVDQNYEQWRGG